MALQLLDVENTLKAAFHFIFDVLIFMVKSIYFTLETLICSLIPSRFRHKKNVIDQVVLITGGGGGVGKLLALNFAKLHAKIILWDINEDALKSTRNLLQQHGFMHCKTYVVDVSKREEIYRVAAQVTDNVGYVDILINNAGIVCCKPFWELTDQAIQNTYNVNILAHYWTIKAFLPYMMESNRGQIVTMGSITGMIGTYGCTDYSATKYACIGFHESLYTELKSHGYDGIQMTLICPYYINTGMFPGVRPRMFPMLEPQYVADKVVEAIRINMAWCVLPSTVRLVTPLKCLLPAKVCWELMSRVIRGPDSMMMFEKKEQIITG